MEKKNQLAKFYYAGLVGIVVVIILSVLGMRHKKEMDILIPLHNGAIALMFILVYFIVVLISHIIVDRDNKNKKHNN